MRKFAIWQRPHGDPKRLEPNRTGEVQIGDFVHVYNFEESEDFTLEDAYQLLADSQPKDYHARAIGIGDLIIVKDSEACDFQGFLVNMIGFQLVKVKGVYR